MITEYQAQIVQDAQGKRFSAHFPGDVTQPVQYGNGVKAHAVYLSQHQLLPYYIPMTELEHTLQINWISL